MNENGCQSGEGTICAVVVTFNPGEQLLDNLSRLRSQIDQVVVVDNSSHPNCSVRVEEICRITNCVLISNSGNLGIARALNVGCTHAVNGGYAWIATFDQDSTITPEFVLRLRELAEHSDNVGLVAPRCVDPTSGVTVNQQEFRPGELLFAMTSGSLLRTHTYLQAGPFRDDFFVDYVDIEFCLRLRSMGYRILEAREAVLIHSPGRMQFHRLLGRSISVTHHSPARRYYITRNRLKVWRMHFQDTSFLRRDSRSFIAETIKIVLFEDQKARKLLYLIRGFIDFVRGKMGPQVGL